MEKDPSDVESGGPRRIGWWTMVMNQRVLTADIVDYPYSGSGTEDDPYIVMWLEDDPRNPMLYPDWIKWSLTMTVAFATLAVSFVSSAYTGGVPQLMEEFQVSEEIITLGVSLFVLGFAVGPLLWAPMSELYGRQILFFGTYAGLTAFNAGACGSQNVTTLLVLRFFAGAFGSSPLTNAGGVIADMFTANQRGTALSLFASAPFMGPVLGPFIGGFVGETVGWKWIEGVMAIFTGVLWIFGSLVIPETYPPVLLRQRATALTKLTGKIYKSKADAEQGKITAAKAFKTALSRPWVLLLFEPIVLLLTIYLAIVYGTLYLLFAAYPIVFQQGRGWSQGIGGLPFLGIAVGMIAGVAYALWDNKRFVRAGEKDPSGYAPPEARLPPGAIGGVAIPIGLFWFAWTTYPSIHWISPTAAGAPLGFGMVLIFLSVFNYLIDAYTIFAASVLAANSVLRSLFGAAFPLFTAYMYEALGTQWASSIPAFLALACVPLPFLFYKYGPTIRRRCKYAAEADDFLRQMRGQEPLNPANKDESAISDDADADASASSSSAEKPHAVEDDAAQHQEEEHDTASDASPRARRESVISGTFAPVRSAAAPGGGVGAGGSSGALSLTRHTSASGRSVAASQRSGLYEENPYDIDRVNTRESFAQRGVARSSKATSRASSPGKTGGGGKGWLRWGGGE